MQDYIIKCKLPVIQTEVSIRPVLIQLPPENFHLMHPVHSH